MTCLSSCYWSRPACQSIQIRGEYLASSGGTTGDLDLSIDLELGSWRWSRSSYTDIPSSIGDIWSIFLPGVITHDSIESHTSTRESDHCLSNWCCISSCGWSEYGCYDILESGTPLFPICITRGRVKSSDDLITPTCSWVSDHIGEVVTKYSISASGLYRERYQWGREYGSIEKVSELRRKHMGELGILRYRSTIPPPVKFWAYFL